MNKPKLVLVLTDGKVTSAYASPELLNRIDIQIVDYDKEGLEPSLDTELAELEIKENFLIEQEICQSH